MSEQEKVLHLSTRVEAKIIELNQMLQQIGDRLLRASPEAQNIIGQLRAWKEIAAFGNSEVGLKTPPGDPGGVAGMTTTQTTN